MSKSKMPPSAVPFAGRPTALALALVVVLAAAPAEAQFRGDAPRPAPVAVGSAPGLSLGSLFNAQTLQLSHSAELSTTSSTAGTVGLAVYTSSLQWQPSARVAGRVELAVAHSPFSSGALRTGLGLDEQPTRVFLRNAELAVRPTANSVLHFSVQQSPYGRFASPYGMSGLGLSPFGRDGGLHSRAAFGTSGSDRLFFRDGR